MDAKRTCRNGKVFKNRKLYYIIVIITLKLMYKAILLANCWWVCCLINIKTYILITNNGLVYRLNKYAKFNDKAQSNV